MKPKIVELDIKSQRAERSVGDAPGIGKVAKVSDAEPPTRGEWRRRRQETQGRGERVDHLMRLIVLSSVFLGFLLVGALLFFWTKKKYENEVGTGDERPVARIQEPAIRAVPPPVLNRSAALDLVRRALATRYVGRVDDYYRLGVAGDRGEVIDFLEQLQSRDGLMVGLHAMEQIQANGYQLGRVVIETEAGGVSHKRLALIVHDPLEGWKIDFEAFARMVEPSWSELVAGSSKEGIVRVIATPGPAEENPSQGWEPWLLQSPDVGQILHAYCRVQTPQAAAMNEVRVTEGELGGRRVTLVVGPMVGKASGDFEIKRVIAEDWVVSEKVFDEVVR